MFYCKTIKDYPCSVDYIFLSIPGICLLLNLYGIIRILCFTKEMTFETYVLLSGVLESVLFYLYRLLQRDYFIYCQEFLHETIALIIIYKFSRIILQVKGKIYKLFTLSLFISALALSIFLFIVIFYNELSSFMSIEHDNIVKTTQSIFYFIIGSSLIVFGCYLKNIIRHSLVQVYINEDIDLCLEDPSLVKENKEDKRKEKVSSTILYSFDKRERYYSIRITQLNIIIYSDFITDLLMLICIILQKYFLMEHFYQNELIVMPKTIIGCVILIIGEICSLIVTISYFFAYYFILSDTFTIRKNTINEVIGDSAFCFSLQHEQTDIKNFLSFDKSQLHKTYSHNMKDVNNSNVNINSRELDISQDLD